MLSSLCLIFSLSETNKQLGKRETGGFRREEARLRYNESKGQMKLIWWRRKVHGVSRNWKKGYGTFLEKRRALSKFEPKGKTLRWRKDLKYKRKKKGKDTEGDEKKWNGKLKFLQFAWREGMVWSRDIVLSVVISPIFLGPSADSSMGAAHLPLSLAPNSIQRALIGTAMLLHCDPPLWLEFISP